MLGAIIGDMVGSVYEFDNVKTMNFPLFTEESNYTDDSIMTLAVEEWLTTSDTECPSLEYAMVNFAKQYPCPKGGYGGRFRTWLFNPEQLPPHDGSRQPYKSWGNGSAMRVSFCGWKHDTIEEVEKLAQVTAEITHNHPEGIKGAQATAVAILLARKKMSKEQIRSIIEQRYGYDLHRSCDEIRPHYHFDESCQGTVPEAIIAFLDSTNFESAIRLAVSLGGDSDTLACITGGIAEAYYGKIPEWIREEAYKRLPERFKEILAKVYKQIDLDKKKQDEMEQMKNREDLMTTWQLDEFYKEMAKEEGDTKFAPRTKEMLLLDYVVAGTTYCKDKALKKKDFIKEGQTLRMLREENVHDANAIALYVEDVKIGYVPKAHNTVVARLMDAGKLLVSRVCKLPDSDGWKKIEAKIWMIEL